MKIRHLLYLLPALLFACHGSDQIENRGTFGEEQTLDKPATDTLSAKTAFFSFFNDLQSAVYNEDADTFNHFIDQEHGLYIIENPGAMPRMTLVKDISNFKREFQDQSFFTIKIRLQTCQLQEESLPTFNCEGQTAGNSGYSKEGCFVADANAFRETEIYKFAGLSEDEQNHIKKMLPLVQKTVLQTSSSYQFHFGQLNGKWKVLFIDLRVPCSA
jgi:hypothetical protein